MSKNQHPYHISLQSIINTFELEKLYEYEGDPKITSMEVTRPGLSLIGYFELFDPLRIEIMGKVCPCGINNA